MSNDPRPLSYDEQRKADAELDLMGLYDRIFRRAAELYDGPGKLEGGADDCGRTGGDELDPFVWMRARPQGADAFGSLNRFEDMLIALKQAMHSEWLEYLAARKRKGVA